jgi:Flp pilus assembly protein TadG
MSIVMFKKVGSNGGQTIIEFAFILPLLLIILLGIIEFGVLLYDKAVITNASREGARYGIVLRNPRYTQQQIEDYARDYCKNHLLTFGGTSNPTANATVPVTQAFGDQLTVQVNYTYHYLAIYRFAGYSPTIQLSSTTTMTYE